MKRSYLLLLLICFLGVSCGGGDNPTDLPVVSKTISIEDLSFTEGDQEMNLFLRIQISAPVTNAVTVIIKTVDGTAIGGEDFEILDNVPVVFEPGDQLQEYKMKVFGDEEFEGDEEFTVEIVDAGGVSISKQSATIKLLNDDQGSISVNIPTTGYTSPLTYPGMSLVWQDEFDGSAIDESNWTFEIGNGNSGWGNNELQYYRKENAIIKEGNLVIEAREENFGGRSYTSTRMITRGKYFFKYGRVDIRANLPYGKGIWPALWMLGENFTSVGWPSCGEIDIMELIGDHPDETHGTIHWSNAGQHASFGGSTKLSSGIFNDEFHVFSIVWEANRIQWLLDDKVFHTASISPAELSEFRENFFFIFNVAVGGNWPGNPDNTTVFPQHMIVDYIRVFQ